MKPISRTNRGFSLAEILVALTILGLLTGSLYSIFHVTLGTVAEIESVENEDRAIQQFIRLLRDTLESLPPGASVSCATPEDGQVQELVVSGVPEAFSVGEDPVAGSDLTIKLQPYEPGDGETREAPVYRVAINREEFVPVAKDGEMAIRMGSGDDFYQPDEDGKYWLPLFPGISTMTWRFWNEEEDVWEDLWEEAEAPPLIELQIQPENRPAPIRVVFNLKPLPVIAQASGNTGTTQNAGGGNGLLPNGGNNNNGGGGQGSGRPGQGGGEPGRGGGGGEGRGPGGPGGPGGGGGPGFGPPPGGGGFGPPGGGGFGPRPGGSGGVPGGAGGGGNSGGGGNGGGGGSR